MFQPFKTAIIKIGFIQRRISLVHQVEVTHAILYSLIHRILQQMPAQTFVAVPFPVLTELTPHKQQFLAGMSIHKAVIGTQVGKLLPLVTRHFTQHRPLAVNHFVVGNRQDKILVKRIEQTKRKQAVMILTIDRIFADIAQSIVHPAHIPLITEPETAHRSRARNHRPCGRLLGTGTGAAVQTINQFVHSPQKGDCFQIFVTAVNVGNPLAGIAGIIEIKHRSHRVHPQAVNVIFPQPVKGVGAQIVKNFGTAVVINFGSPVFVFAFARIGVLIEVGAVKFTQPVAVLRKVGRNPVHDHRNPRLVKLVYQITQIVGGAETAGRRKHTDDLIAPRSIQRMFGQRQKFDVRKTHVGNIRNQRIGHFAIAEIF